MCQKNLDLEKDNIMIDQKMTMAAVCIMAWAASRAGGNPMVGRYNYQLRVSF